MTIDESAVTGLRATLAADDYGMEVRRDGAGVQVLITAGPEACEDCRVPKPIMRSILQNAFGVPEDAITLVYPGENPSGEQKDGARP